MLITLRKLRGNVKSQCHLFRSFWIQSKLDYPADFSIIQTFLFDPNFFMNINKLVSGSNYFMNIKKFLC